MSELSSIEDVTAADAPPSAMTPQRLRECMDFLKPFQWTRRGLARLFGYSSGTSWRDKMANRVRTTRDEAEWLEKCVAFFKANPPPKSVGTRWKPTEGEG